MRRRRSGWIWSGRIAAVAVTVGLVAYLSSAGLDKADKLAGVLGMLVAAAALIVPYLMPSSTGDQPKPGAGQRVANTVVGGHLTQVRDSKGVRIQESATAASPPTAKSNPGHVPEGQTGQYINDVWVGGNLTQIDGADGDVSIG